MQIIIDIPEEIYNCLTHNEFDATLVTNRMRDCILYGIPIPKEYGRLIAETDVVKALFILSQRKKTIGQCVEDTPTIVEE